EAVRRGRNLVIQGPPGTGKSQTIANLVAAAVREGKKVLFVAEKMAALDVVKRRLANVGLGDMCLELHSHKARKRAVLDDLQHTMSLGDPKDRATDDYFERLTEARDTLNRHAAQLHTPIADTGVTPYVAIGHLVRLRSAGVAPADFTLDGPAGWDETQAAAAHRALDALTEQVETLGTPADHPWRGAGVASILPMDLERLIDKLPDAAASLRSAEGKARDLADLLEDDHRLTPGHVNALADRARRLAETPPLDPEAIAHDVWAQQGPAVTELVEQGLAVDTLRQQLDGVVAEAAWSADLSQARLDLAAHGSSWLRFLNPNYRNAKRQLQAVLTGPLPKDHAERLQLLDRLIEARSARNAIERGDAVGRYAFGSMWRGIDSDFAALSRVHGWNRRNEQRGDAKTCRQLVALREDLDAWKAELPGAADAAERAVASAGRAFDAAAATVSLDLSEAFGVEELIDLPLTAAADRLEAWHAAPDGLSRWIAYCDRRAAARDAGLGQLVDRLEAAEVTPGDAADAFGMAYYEALLRRAFDDRPELARFDGETHERTLAVFRELDGQRLALARHEVAEAHHAGLPRGGGEVGQVGLLRREFQKKRRHLPLRRLLREAGLAVQAVKPVFMMSPMSVAQYLEPGGLNFDLMLIDEASQVRPVDALGAVARCRQIVVVGDDKQLPPTRFFDAMTSAGEDGEDDDAAELDTSDLESILGLCTAQNVPTAMLRWHYRSLHPSLIAVSNREFYDGNLYVIP
ncbi:MAG: AAA domain-containing protein, partial [Planctomycetota bacterium]